MGGARVGRWPVLEELEAARRAGLFGSKVCCLAAPAGVCRLATVLSTGGFECRSGVRRLQRMNTRLQQPARSSGEFAIGGDLLVVRLGYGAMQIPGPGVWGEPRDRDEVIRVLRRAIELGVTFIDTADTYGPEVSERIMREALHPYPDDLVIATKAGLTR